MRRAGREPISTLTLAGRYRSGQTGRTVNPLAYAFAGSNPALPIFFSASSRAVRLRSGQAYRRRLRDLPPLRALDRDAFARPLLLREAVRFDFPAAPRDDFAPLPRDFEDDFVREDLRAEAFAGFTFFATLLAFFATRLAVLRTPGMIGLPLATLLAARAPTTPPTTAPMGPATLPIAAPVTAPAVCFGIAGI
ncbi:MAG: hypothetical protein QOE73_661 [Verrucomicrobiota bacterium]